MSAWSLRLSGLMGCGIASAPSVPLWRIRDSPTVPTLSSLYRPNSGEFLRISKTWSGRRDSDPGPPAPKAGALPGCATPRPMVENCSEIDRKLPIRRGFLDNESQPAVSFDSPRLPPFSRTSPRKWARKSAHPRGTVAIGLPNAAARRRATQPPRNRDRRARRHEEAPGCHALAATHPARGSPPLPVQRSSPRRSLTTTSVVARASSEPKTANVCRVQRSEKKVSPT
jgi:hypothetical protein